MALMSWNAKYSVGVHALDDQHTGLFDILNELHAAMMKGQAQSLTGPLLKKLVEYTRKHFAAEEAMLALNVHLLNFLRDWLTNHIQKTDHQYGPWLNEHGVR